MGIRAFAVDSLAEDLGFFGRRYGSLKMSKSSADDVVSRFISQRKAIIRPCGICEEYLLVSAPMTLL